MLPRLFIGIPCYQESDSLKRTVEFISRNTEMPYTLEVHVARQSVVRNKNELLKKARASGADYVCLCDDDVEPEPGWAEKLIRGVEEVQKNTRWRVGQTGPLIVYPDHTIFYPWINVHFNFTAHRHVIAPASWQTPVEDVHRTILEAGALAGTLTVFTRPFLDRVGWTFDDRYEKSQYEDIDQSLTCRSEGFLALYNGTVSVIHHALGASPRSVSENYEKLIEKWLHREDLSLVIPPDSEMVRRAQEVLFDRSSLWSRIGRFRSLLSNNLFGRMRTGLTLLRRHGLRGFLNQCRYKMMTEHGVRER
jgi:glycosyltransferase involved in cell wall biosynthesis